MTQRLLKVRRAEALEHTCLVKVTISITANACYIGIVGEKNIYRRRQEENPEPGDPQQKPKRLLLIVDVSGSMYRLVK